MNHILTWVVFLPLLAIPLLFLAPRSLAKWITLIAVIVDFVVALPLLRGFDPAKIGVTDINTFQYVEKLNWIPSLGIEYLIGLDGLSYPMVLLTLIISIPAVLASWNVKTYERGFFSMFILLHCSMLGVFVALDMVLFFLFWEVMLLPMYFLIGMWGGPRRIYAAIKFFLFTLFGSVGMLLAIIAIWKYVPGESTFNIVEILHRVQSGQVITGPDLFGIKFATLVFMALFVGFAVKVPLFPFHTWLPDAHVEAPTAISVILAGVLLKMGTYGMLRFNFTLFPEVFRWFSPYLAALAIVNIVYGALCALAQKDLKKMVAYSSVSHMGFVVLGLASATDLALGGAILQMFNHGTITAMLFLLVGVVYDRAHHREIEGFGGLASVTPVYAAITSFAYMAAIGLPGTSGFISEFCILSGSFQIFPILTIVAGSGIILGAAYMLYAYQRIFFGKVNEKYKDLKEVNVVELVALIPLGLIVLYLGILPSGLMAKFESSVHMISSILRN